MTETVEIPALLPALPEIVLAIGAMVLLMVGAFRGEQTAKGIEGAAILLLALTGLIVVLLPAGKLVTFGGSFIVDGFARFLKLLALAGSATAILMSSNYLAREKRETFEYSILILLSTTGMMMLISAADLIALYLGLELMSLALYVVAAINRDSVRSTEAGLKYFVLGALSSGMLLYGASLVYGFTGTVSFAGIASVASQGSAGTASLGLVFGLVFLFAGFCFKVSAVPFHMWTPDVYDGARRFCSHRPKEYQTADGLFVHRPHGVRAGRARRRNAAGRSGCAGVRGDLCRHDARSLRLHPVDATRRADGGRDRRSRRPCPHQADDGVLLRHAVVLARGHSAPRRLFRQVLRVSRGDSGGAVHACRHRRNHQRRG